MSQISPAIQEKLNSLPIDLKNEILSRKIPLNSLNDLITVLEQIVQEG